MLNWETNKRFLFVIVSFFYSLQKYTIGRKKRKRNYTYSIVIIDIKITNNSFCFVNKHSTLSSAMHCHFKYFYWTSLCFSLLSNTLFPLLNLFLSFYGYVFSYSFKTAFSFSILLFLTLQSLNKISSQNNKLRKNVY